MWREIILISLSLTRTKTKYNYCVSAPGGWREGEFSNCHGTCGNAIKSQYKYCDNPEPSHRWVQGVWQQTGEKCHCNSTDATEVSCDGHTATIDQSCNDDLCK